jgi:hypothetical protein
MEKTNRYWILPRLGLTESLKIEEVMKQRFVQLFNGDVRRPFDHILMKRLADVTGHTSEDDLADYITYLVARVGILKTFVKSGNAVPSEVFKKSASDVLVLLHPGASQEIASLYADLFYTFLSWEMTSTLPRPISRFYRMPWLHSTKKHPICTGSFENGYPMHHRFWPGISGANPKGLAMRNPNRSRVLTPTRAANISRPLSRWWKTPWRIPASSKKRRKISGNGTPCST